MANAGAQPGERRGGRDVGVPNQATILALKRAEQQLLDAKAAGHTLAVDVLNEFMHLFAHAARARKPMVGEDGKNLNPLDDLPGFDKYAKLTVDTAAQLAKYQSPTFRAITVAPPPPTPPGGPQRKRFTLTIFDSQGRKAVAHVTPIASQPIPGTNGKEPVTIDVQANPDKPNGG